MKKGVVVLLLLLAVIVLVSPAIVGRLAEQSMDENIDWAAMESGAVKVTSEHFDRGWFSSEGQHRVELQEGDLLTALQMLTGPLDADDLPVLVINTRLDHGLIPVSSMAREKGSRAPGLGSAISTLQLEAPDGELIDLPGTIYSKVALGGELQSNYVLEAGNRDVDGADAEWGRTSIEVTTDPRNGAVSYEGDVGSFSVQADGDRMRLVGLRFEGHQQPTKYGIAVGDVSARLDELSFGEAGAITSFAADAESALDGDRVDARASLKSAIAGMPPFNDMQVDMAFTLSGADAQTLGALQRAAEEAAGATDPMAIYGTLEADARRLFAAGFEFDVDRIKVALPQGEISSTMAFSFAASDPASFEWASLLLGTEASIDLAIPVALVDMMGQDNPQVAMAIGGGYLLKNGDVYEMKARLKKGLLTVNGAPIPLPLGPQ
mgnify:CR=1 FL=1